MKKVLLVTLSDNADHQDTVFGIYEFLLDRKDIDVYLLATSTPKVPLKQSDHTWFIDCPKKPGIERETFYLHRLMPIVRRINKENFDAIYFESLHVWNIAIMLTLRRRVHTFQVIHDVTPHEGDRHVKGVEFTNRVICKIADTIVLRNKKDVPEVVEKYNIEPCRVKYLELWRRYPEFTKPSYSKRALFFGRINPYKGADNLLEIVRLCPEIEFDVVGRVDPEMNRIITSLKKESNVSLVDGYVSDDDMKRAFIDADWLILPYNSASQSGVIIDAYKYSRPVIAFNVGAIDEQIDDGASGYLVEAGNLAAFVETLTKAMLMSKEEYDAMCSYAYQYGSEKYSASGAVERFVNLLEGKEHYDYY